MASAMVETGSTGDTVIFEEFKGTGNMELKLDRKIADRRVFPAVDVTRRAPARKSCCSRRGTRGRVEPAARAVGMDSQQALDLLISQLRKTKTNDEFLMQVSKTAPGSPDDVD